MSEKIVKIEIKRMRKEDKRVTCKISPKMLEGEIHKDFIDPVSELVFEAGEKSLELDYVLPLVLSDQVIFSLSLDDFGPNASGGSCTTCEITVINDKHAGIVGFSVPEVTFPVSEKNQKIGLLRAAGTDGELTVFVTATDGSAENGSHYILSDPTEVNLGEGEYQTSMPIEFIPGNHGKLVSRNCFLTITSVSGMGRIGQDKCTIQLLTDQAPCAVSFARPEFSFMAGSGDQGECFKLNHYFIIVI